MSRARKWPTLMKSPFATVSLVGASVFAAEYLLLYLLRAFFDPLMRLEMTHSAWNMINATVLIISVSPALYFLVFRKMKVSETRFKHANRAMLDAMIITDARDRIVEWNPAAEYMFQYSRNEALGQQLHHLIPTSPSHSDMESRLAHFAGTGECPCVGKITEVTARRKDGSEFPVELSTSSGRWEGGWHAIGVVRDLTEARRAEDALRIREAQLELIQDHASCPLFTLGVEKGDHLRFLSVNRNFLESTGLTPDQIVGKCIDDIFPQSSSAFMLEKYREAIETHRPVKWEASADYPAGRKIGMVTIAPVFGASDHCTQLIGTVHDVTERRASDRKIQRQTRLYAALSQCNEAIVRCGSEEVLFREVCRIAVDAGGLKMAWIGQIDHGTQSHRAVAAAGNQVDEVLEGFNISAASDSPFGGGLVGQAVRSSQPAWCQDYLRDARTAPWHERGARFELGAAAVLPLERDGVVMDVLVLFAHKADAFDQAIRDLLVQMASDISFALDNLAHEAARAQAQVELSDSEERFRGLIEHSVAGVYQIQGDELIYANPRMVEMLGYASADELTGHSPLVVVAEKDRAIIAEKMALSRPVWLTSA